MHLLVSTKEKGDCCRGSASRKPRQSIELDHLVSEVYIGDHRSSKDQLIANMLQESRGPMESHDLYTLACMMLDNEYCSQPTAATRRCRWPDCYACRA